MSTASDPIPVKALRAALTLFARHGFNRTSMADVAEAAGISRATLYVHFKDKAALFDGLADNLVRDALASMRDAWHDGAPFAENLAAVILARDLPLHRLKHTSPHGGELLASDSESARTCARTLDAEFLKYLRKRAGEAAKTGRRFEVFGGIAAFGPFVSEAAAGFKTVVVSEDRYRCAIHTFAALVEAATQ